jgi:AcrR family transcriptional regulator
MSPASPDRKWTRRKEARPGELTAAALELFVERGYAATRLDDVAAKAGVSKGTLYLYFSSKEDLFKAVVREGIVPAIERGEKLFEEHTGSVADLISDLIQGWWESIGSTRLAGIPKLMISESGNFPEIAQFYYQEVISRGHRLVGSALRRGMEKGEFRKLDVEYTVRLILAPLVMLAVWRFSFDICDSNCLEPKKYLEQHIDIVLNGLRDRETHFTRPAQVVELKTKGKNR